jgi:hypothetical protein
MIGYLVVDVFGSGDGMPVTLVDGLTAGVDAGAITGAGYGFGPGQKIGGLFGKETTTLFLIEKEDGVGREVFAASSDSCSSSIALPKQDRGVPGFLGFQNFGVEPSVEEDEEAEAPAQESFTLALPGILTLTGWVVQPISGERKMATESGESIVAGIVVAIETGIALFDAGRCLSRGPLRPCKGGEEERETHYQEPHKRDETPEVLTEDKQRLVLPCNS